MNPNANGVDEAIDAPLGRRPGVPAERTPEPVANAHWLKPPQQVPTENVLKDIGHEKLTATFGTAQPPRGLSGRLRRVAYRIPDYYPRRWLLLIIADRIDMVESTLERLFKPILPPSIQETRRSTIPT